MTIVKTKRNKKRTPEQWQAIFAAQAASGLSIEAFCTERGIGHSTFSRWKSRLGGQSCATRPSPTSFVALSPPADAVSPDLEVELNLGEGVVLRIVRR